MTKRKHSNAEFVDLSPAETCNVSASDNMERVAKVLWKGDWCLSISKYTGPHPSPGGRFHVYHRWPQLRMSWGDYETLDAAKAACIKHVEEIEKFLLAKFTLPSKTKPKSTTKESP